MRLKVYGVARRASHNYFDSIFIIILTVPGGTELNDGIIEVYADTTAASYKGRTGYLTPSYSFPPRARTTLEKMFGFSSTRGAILAQGREPTIGRFA